MWLQGARVGVLRQVINMDINDTEVMQLFQDALTLMSDHGESSDWSSNHSLRSVVQRHFVADEHHSTSRLDNLRTTTRMSGCVH